jgi:hypothetical protein
MNDQDASKPPMRPALVPKHPPLAPRAPSSIPHVSPTGIIKERDENGWRRWLGRKRKSRD